MGPLQSLQQGPACPAHSWLPSHAPCILGRALIPAVAAKGCFLSLVCASVFLPEICTYLKGCCNGAWHKPLLSLCDDHYYYSKILVSWAQESPRFFNVLEPLTVLSSVGLSRQKSLLISTHCSQGHCRKRFIKHLKLSPCQQMEPFLEY